MLDDNLNHYYDIYVKVVCTHEQIFETLVEFLVQPQKVPHFYYLITRSGQIR